MFLRGYNTGCHETSLLQKIKTQEACGERKDEWVRIRVTEAEKEHMKEIAKHCGKTLSEWLRDQAADDRVAEASRELASRGLTV